jgi:hypothetical protein
MSGRPWTPRGRLERGGCRIPESPVYQRLLATIKGAEADRPRCQERESLECVTMAISHAPPDDHLRCSAGATARGRLLFRDDARAARRYLGERRKASRPPGAKVSNHAARGSGTNRSLRLRQPSRNLFVSALGNNTVEVVNNLKVIHTIRGLGHPQAALYVAERCPSRNPKS